MAGYPYDELHLAEYEITKEEEPGKHAFFFVCVVVALVGFGLITLYSASYDEALRHGLSSHYYFLRQLLFALLGFGAFILIRYIPQKWFRFLIPVFFILSVVLMLLTLFTPLGVARLGAKRWLQIGFLPSFQPSELLKVSVILLLAQLPAKQMRSVIISSAIIALAALLIVLQRDYSTTMLFLVTALAMLIAMGVSLYLIGLFAVAVAVPAGIFLFTEPYRIERLVSFLFPTIDPTGLNWQVHNSLQAIRSGGLFGKGLGNGTYKLGVIPEVQSDFIFASLAEETGIFGVVIFFTLFSAFAVLAFRSAKGHAQQQHRFIALSVFGITFMIIWQALVHIAVVVALLPPTGIPLPFFSQGGTNLFIILAECGLLFRWMGMEASYG
jgi:cell division protein FtsW